MASPTPTSGPDTPTDDATARALRALATAVYYLDRELAAGQKVRAFQRAAGVVASLDADQLEARVAAGSLTDLDGIGASTASVIVDAVTRGDGTYLADL
jgi:putative hydrolase